jgi:hypothetical protein
MNPKFLKTLNQSEEEIAQHSYPLSDSIDIDFNSIADYEDMSHTTNVSQPQPHPLNAANLSHRIENTSMNPYYQTLKADWPIQMSLALQLDLNSKCEFHSFPFDQKLTMDQSETFILTFEFHRDGGDNVSARFDFSNFADEVTFIGNRRSTAIVIEDSD